MLVAVWGVVGESTTHIAGQAPAEQIVVFVGLWQYYAVWQYSVVCHVWGPGRVAMFLTFRAYTPVHILIGIFLTAPVHCKGWCWYFVVCTI